MRKAVSPTVGRFAATAGGATHTSARRIEDRGMRFTDSTEALRLELSLVRLLTRANESLDSFGGFDALLLLEFIYPVGDVTHHIGSGFARGLAGGPGSAGLSLAALFALHYSYFFL